MPRTYRVGCRTDRLRRRWGGIEAAIARYGPGYVWASEFENVHATWAVVEPPFAFHGHRFRGSEQLFQLQKIPRDAWTDADVAAFATATPQQAFVLGQDVELRRDWNEFRVDAMRLALRCKFTAGEDAVTVESAPAPTLTRAELRALLTSTEGRPLVSVKHDAFWGAGAGPRSTGSNMLPRLLDELRSELSAADGNRQ